MHLKTQITCGTHFKNLAVALLSLLVLPTALQAADPARRVALSWNPNPESNVAGYKVCFGTVQGVLPQLIDAGPSTTALLPEMILGMTYYMTVSAYDMEGQEGLPSAEFVVTPALPQPVGNTAFSLLTSGEGELRWTYAASSGTAAESFAVHASENLVEWSVAGTALPTAGGSSYSFPVSIVPGKSRMFFRVTAINPFGESQ